MEPDIGKPMWRGPAAARVSTRARGATLWRDRQPTRCAGQPSHRPGSAAPTSVGAVARPAARPSGANSRRPRGKGRTLEREGARASATRPSGGWKPQRGRLWHRRGEQGRVTDRASFRRDSDPLEQGRNVGRSSRGGVARCRCFQHVAQRRCPWIGKTADTSRKRPRRAGVVSQGATTDPGKADIRADPPRPCSRVP